MENRFDLSNDDDQIKKGKDQQQEYYLKTQKMEQDDAEIIERHREQLEKGVKEM